MTGTTPHRHHAPTTGLRVEAELAALKGVLTLLKSLPVEKARPLAGRVVERVGMSISRLRRVGMENLAGAFPDRDAAWHERVLRGSFRQLGYMAIELAHFEKLDTTNIRDVIGFESDESERCFRERATERKSIIATGHFGNWELLGQATGLMGMPIHVVHRPLKNPKVDDLLTEVRGLAGTQVVYKHAAARDILKLLRKKAVVVIPIDQHAPGRTGIPVPFFGRPARTTPGPARLAQIAQVPVQVAVLARVGETGKHQIVARRPIPPPPKGKDPALLVEMTARLNDEFEAIVRKYPEQWLWMHRRWRVPT